MKHPLVSVIIINWNGLRWLPDCFGSLRSQEYKNIEIIFVDNASHDGSVAWVMKHHPKTKIAVNEKNLGFADANNVGYKRAKGDFVLFLNNDTRVTKTFLTEMLAVLEKNPKVGAVQSKILLMDEPTRHDSVGAYLTPTGFLYHFGFGKPDSPKYDKPFFLYTAKGACMCFRKDVLDKVALDGNIFEPDYFAYFEETDLCHRVWIAGYRVLYAYKSVIYHKMGATSTKMDNAFVQYHSFKNRIHSYLKNLNPVRLCLIMPVHFLFCGIFVFASLLRGKFGHALAIHRAYWWNITRLGETLRQRYVIQHTVRRVGDGEYWPLIFRKPKLMYYWYLSKGVAGYEEDI